ncbi:glycoside hydrolase family 2 TIM barrel-domain containing protein [Niabella drilacis]|uniref:beta-galactosidase n=1 Tax=Niabella drilacis (strain DSM 25811 / CCM 8410 / CCUG 62505 / LMG 26954 / E90) TaxID=1285928 RepID=A0A1G6RHR8_NIADE|nr:glycoside hydrolase family 2 TIM barrel-domain containing protein [Niabella drilacis]SDD03991.1 Beta-galactosidase/beta-glucuronidase [Niabella drilacis]
MKKLKVLICFLFLVIAGTTGLQAQDTQVKYLSGRGADDTVNWNFLCSAGRRSGKWTSIAVPSCWEQQGFGAYNYGHDPLKERLNETGTYRYTFTVPAGWKNLETRIVFEGVMTDAEVHINGMPAGAVHQGAFYEFGYNISKLLKFGGKNELQVLVKKNSGNASVNEAERTADFWMFGGIFRPVYLEAKPKMNIQRVAVDARGDGAFTADVYLSGFRQAAAVQVKLTPLPVKPSKTGKTVVLSAAVTGAKTQIKGTAGNVLTWTPELPNRYRAVFELLDQEGRVLHRYNETIGFRTVEVRDADGVYVNGVRIKMKGVNRHTFHPKYGRTSSKALSIRDVNTIKDMNMNAVRMSHYPPEKHFLDACDSLGLFVLDELTGWQKPPYDDTVGLKLLKEMVIRDVNHPGILLWDNGNEGGNNYTLDTMFGKLDIQQREVLHPWQQFGKFNTAHYISYNYLAHDDHSRRKIFLPTEFMHGLYDGGAGAGLEDYWQQMWRDPLCAGGFIWDYADEALERTDRNDSLDTDGNHAPDGILGPYLEKEGSYYAVREIWAPVFFEQRYITPAFDGKFRIENRFIYTDLKECHFEASWIKCPGPGMKAPVEKDLAKPVTVSLKPGQKGTLEVDMPGGWMRYDALQITARDPFGRLIHTWTWPVKSAGQSAAELLPRVTYGATRLSEEGDSWQVAVGELRLSFNKKTALLTRVMRNGVVIPLSNGPVLISREQVLKKVACYQQQDTVYLSALYESGNDFTWKIGPDGLARLTVNYEPKNNNLFAGVSFDFPESEVTGIRWLGNGPYRVYKNRLKGASFGLWEKAYNNTVTGESGYIYPEFKGYHAGTYWAELGAKDKKGFTVYIASDDIFLRLFTPPTPRSPAKTAIEYPPGNISFLHSINAIGTKFDSLQGPQAALNPFNGYKLYEGLLQLKLVFDFNPAPPEQ